jgi:flavin-dependent dehydrogenase
LARLVGDAIELHLFCGGYAGIVRQEGGSVNICLAVRKSLLKARGGDPAALLMHLGRDDPAFGERMQHATFTSSVDTVAAVPYGFIARETPPGLFRLGDQAAVIPSLAGEGMSIAVASGLAAAQAYLAGGANAAPAYQRSFARRAWRPVRTAQLVWHLAERQWGAAALLSLAQIAPPLTQTVMNLSRIAQPRRVIQPWRSSAVPS